MSKHCAVTGMPPSTCPCGACWDDEDEAQDGSDEGETQKCPAGPE